MADEAQQPDEPSTEDELMEEIEDWEGRDPILTRIVEVANTGHFSYGVTLTIGGQMITGQAISFKKWHQLAHETSRDAFTAGAAQLALEDSEEMPDDLPDGFATMMFGTEPEVTDLAETVSALPRYIHLQDSAQVTPDGRVPSTGGSLWRGKIASVDGWTMGSLESR